MGIVGDVIILLIIVDYYWNTEWLDRDARKCYRTTFNEQQNAHDLASSDAYYSESGM